MTTLIKPLLPELQKVVIEEFGEVPSRIPKDLQALKEWMQQQPHLKPYNDDQYLIQYLRVSKYSLEKAKEKLDFWLSVPKKYFINDIDDGKFQQLIKTGLITTLPTPFQETGPRIVLVRLNYDTEVFSAEDYLRCFLAVHFAMTVSDPYAGIHGCIYYFDLAGFTRNHLLQNNISFLKNVVLPISKNSNFRIKRIYILNPPNYAVHLIKFFISFMSEKIRKRVFVCNTKSIVDKDNEFQKCLPLEYGGENGCLQQLAVEQANFLNKHCESWKEFYECRSDERLRMGKSPFASDELMGTTGSFRSLIVD